jgi:hypothetical protein
MNLGFTGTRRGMTWTQMDKLRKLIREGEGLESFHHGDCLGADAEAHWIVWNLGVGKIVGHPPDNERLRAFCLCDELRAPLPYLNRNRAMVREVDLLVAAPATQGEEQRSGTWSTVRYASLQGTPYYIIYPNGIIDYVGEQGTVSNRAGFDPNGD